jgi:DNA-damage-inducible protein J
MADTANLNIRMDKALKAEADALFNALGMNLTTAITVFVRQAVRERKIPFTISMQDDDAQARRICFNASLATQRIRNASVTSGMDAITMDEIDAEIAACRREKRSKEREAL